ncbi:MAG: hypothetical protein IJN56_05690, partial [Clostridia bacterium]|nr:hypothetical protein [Clostridia bacterium]
YAENPIGFILKHELTHFGEKSSRYIEFVKTVKKSKLYKKWITEKTGESDPRIAEYKYKQAVANTHSDIYGAADPKAEAEMIADFVGEMLFTEKGRVYSKTIPLTDVAWINGGEGQYAEIGEAQKNTAESDSVVRFSERDYSYKNRNASDYYSESIIYTYDFLVSQKDMKAVTLPATGTLANTKGKIDDAKVLSEGKKNILSVGIEKNGKTYVKNLYTNRELRIDNSTIKHGLSGTYNKHLTNARIASVIGSVVQNAIPINALKNTSAKAEGTYAMVAYCRDNQNREFIAVVTVEQHTNNIDSFELYDVAHAVSGRQKNGSQVDTKSQGVYPIKATTISIADLLTIVNDTHQSILSDDVLSRLGQTRNPDGAYSDKVLFSQRDPAFVSDRDTSKPRDYSYESLVSKRDMRINFLVKATEKEMSSYKADRNLFAKNMIKNAIKVGNVNNADTKTFLHCNDLNRDVLITRNSFKHGAARIDETYVSVCKSIADIIENSIVVNEFKERSQTNGSYVLLGLAENENNYVVVRSVVDKKTWRLENYEELYAIRKKSIKKEDVGVKAPALPSKTGYGTSSTISIVDFLRFVNSLKMANSVLSLDVVKKLNSDRTYDDIITPSLLYSQRAPVFVSDRDTSKPINSWEKQEIEKICNKFGIDIVFEDLREMVDMGEILSPDGYIEKDKGIIHLNLYAENPIGFILKHELTHFGEKSSRYI